MVADETAIPRRRRGVLCIGGTDPTGGAGLSADVRTGAGVGLDVATVVACVTVQSERGVGAVHLVPGDVVGAQAEAALATARPAAIKVGALGSAAAAETVAAFVQRARLPVVLDPVLAASAGGSLAPPAVRRLLFTTLASRSTVVTPNRPELEAWVGEAAPDLASVMECARHVAATVETAVCVKGGHGPADGVVVDVLALPSGEVVRYEHPRRPGGPFRGTGCTFATALAAGLAAGRGLVDAVAEAVAYVDAAWQTSRSACSAASTPGLAVPKLVPAPEKVVRIVRE